MATVVIHLRSLERPNMTERTMVTTEKIPPAGVGGPEGGEEELREIQNTKVHNNYTKKSCKIMYN